MNPHYAVLHWSNMAGESSPSMIFPAMFDCQRVSLLSRFLVIPFSSTSKHHSTTIQPPFNHHSTTIQPPFTHHSATIQPPFNHHSTTIQSPFNHHSITIQPPFNHHSTTIQSPFNHHSTTIQPLFNHHSTTIQPSIQPHRTGAIPIEPAVSLWYPHRIFFEPALRRRAGGLSMLGLGVLDSQTEEAEEMARGLAVALGGLGLDGLWTGLDGDFDEEFLGTSKTHQLVIHSQSSE